MSGVDYGNDGLRQEMERELRDLLEQDRPLTVYFGIDPTATSLTLGHTVGLRKLRQFQDLGHRGVLLIGDYTALIGDPSDKNKSRPMLTSEQIALNEKTYFGQASRILDASRTELRHNSEWLSKLTLPDIIRLMSKFTVQEMLRRDNFRKRFGRTTIDVLVSSKTVRWTSPVVEPTQNDAHTQRYRANAVDLNIIGFGVDNWRSEAHFTPSDPIFLHEFLYALMQGYDAFALECDVQVGGTEQLFNLMAGRKIQEDAGQRPHVPVTMPILVGLDGKERMSKSKGNHIGVSDSPDEQYGKAMSLPDEAVMDFFVLATNVPRTELDGLRAELARDPMGTKKRLARTIVSEFWGEPAADEARGSFERTVVEQSKRKKAFEWTGREEDYQLLSTFPGESIADYLTRHGVVASKRKVADLVRQGAVRRTTNVNMTAVGAPAATPGLVVEPSEPALRPGEMMCLLEIGKLTRLQIVRAG